MRRVLAVLVALFVLGTVAGAVCWGQALRYDTTTAQYQTHGATLDSLARGPVLRWAQRLRLHDWTITLSADSLGEGIVAQTVTRDEYKLAWITLDLAKKPVWDVDKVIVHELLHVKVSPYTTLPRVGLGMHGGLLGLVIAREEERLVTELTEVVVRAWATR